MPEVVVANDDLVVLGGPASIQLKLDIGATGTRGSYIYTDVAKPDSDQITLSPSPIAGDMYINVNPSDNEYLYLYQYKLVNGVLTWAKVLRLVPNTVLFNPYFKFIDGVAYTPVVYNGVLIFVKGILFSLGGAGSENQELEGLDHRDLNVNYRVTGNAPVMSTLNITEVGSTFTDIDYIVAATGQEVTGQQVPLDKNYVRASLTIAELNSGVVELVNGYRMVDFLATVGGRSEQVIDIDSVVAATIVGETVVFPGALIIPNNSLAVGDRIVYLAYENTEIVGLTNGAEYWVAAVDGDAVVLNSDGVDPVLLTDATLDGVQSILDLGGFTI